MRIETTLTAHTSSQSYCCVWRTAMAAVRCFTAVLLCSTGDYRKTLSYDTFMYAYHAYKGTLLELLKLHVADSHKASRRTDRSKSIREHGTPVFPPVSGSRPSPLRSPSPLPAGRATHVSLLTVAVLRTQGEALNPRTSRSRNINTTRAVHAKHFGMTRDSPHRAI